jgi:putative beta-lysine N-acetyltransferase
MTGSNGEVMMQSDVVLRHGSSLVQHGHNNNRVYVMKFAPGDGHDIIRFADELVKKEGYSKIFVKVPKSSEEMFARAGYITEATVPNFFHGSETALFMAKYTDPMRAVARDATVLANVLSDAFGYAGERSPHEVPDGFSLMHAHPGDAEEIAALYRLVFETYPFPVFDPEYIRTSMHGHVRYFVIKKSHLLAAVASCEIDEENGNVEVTDFATNPLFRGRGFAGTLLRAMEEDMKNEGVLLAYTIARAIFKPINAVFVGAGYQFGGMLPNNTGICGSMESMNVWYRKL